MTRAIDLAGRLGILNLVFGSPRQRIVPEAMEPSDARNIAIETFRALGDRAVGAGTVIAIEPNPAAYGTNFLNTLEEAAAFVETVAHPGIALILDLGAMHMNARFADTADLLGRINAPLLSIAGRCLYTDTTNGFRAYSARYLLDPVVKPFLELFQRYELLFDLTARAGQIGIAESTGIAL